MKVTFKGVVMSVQDAAIVMSSYAAEDRITEVNELKALIITAKNEIIEKII